MAAASARGLSAPNQPPPVAHRAEALYSTIGRTPLRSASQSMTSLNCSKKFKTFIDFEADLIGCHDNYWYRALQRGATGGGGGWGLRRLW
uniref:Uncharacterized protein n=1 Tax=Knipowitschia caucasica TaxID=637954 RepID=A0AAV2M807_KNICA